MFTREDLKILQRMPFGMKIQKSVAKIIEWYTRHDGKVYISFSGGKDSTVLLHLVRSQFPDVPAVFVNTGLEYPEIVDHVKTFDNVIILRPKKNFRQVIADHGVPVVSKDVAGVICAYRRGKEWAAERLSEDANDFRKGLYKKWQFLKEAPFKISNICCYHMKEAPLHKFARETGLKPYVGTLAAESRVRTQGWLKAGCNSFTTGKRARSAPLSFWLEDEILQYIRHHNLPIAKVYGEVVDGKKGLETTGVERTGCMFCLFGCHLEKEPNRIQKMAVTHPKQYEYCLRDFEDGGLGLRQVMEYVGIPYEKRAEP